MTEEEVKKKKTTKRKRNTNNKKDLKKKDNKLEVSVEKEKNTEVKQKNENKFSFGVMEVVIIMIITVLLGLFIGSYVTYKKYNDKDKDNNNLNKENAKELQMVYDGIVNDYYGDLDEDVLLNSAVEGMLQSLNDPYALFVDKNNALSLDEELKGTFVGLGIEVTNTDLDYITVFSVYNNSPAYKSGILEGDKIVSLDSKKYLSRELDDFVYDIKSSKVGDKRTLTIIRDGEERNIEVTLGEIEVVSVYSSIIEKENSRIGLFTITNFASNTYDQFFEGYSILKNEGIDSIIIDIRDNGGGYLSSACDVASLFLNKNDIVYKRYDGKKEENIVSEKDKQIDMPVVILVNQNTASSSEVFASSLYENLGVNLIGVKTYGKGTIQKLQSLNGGKYIKYTVQEWLTSKGNKIEGIGINPTIEISWDENSEFDVQLEKAIEILNVK